jgi:hypothetical protein
METTSKRPTWFYDDVVDDYAWILRRLRRPETDVSKRRKEFALLAQQTPYPDLLFRLYDGKDIPVRGRGDVWAPAANDWSLTPAGTAPAATAACTTRPITPWPASLSTSGWTGP